MPNTPKAANRKLALVETNQTYIIITKKIKKNKKKYLCL